MFVLVHCRSCCPSLSAVRVEPTHQGGVCGGDSQSRFKKYWNRTSTAGIQVYIYTVILSNNGLTHNSVDQIPQVKVFTSFYPLFLLPFSPTSSPPSHLLPSFYNSLSHIFYNPHIIPLLFSLLSYSTSAPSRSSGIRAARRRSTGLNWRSQCI